MGTSIGSLLAISACAVTLANAADPGAPLVIEAGGDPVTLCAPEGQDGAGERLVLQIDTLDVGTGGFGHIDVDAPGTEATTRIGLFPLAPFSVAAGDEPRRFLLPGPADVCRELRIEGEKITATVSLRIEPAN